jgi:alpha-D-xyloside xylohydrolase
MQWNDNHRTLTIADRRGNYDGMLTNRIFNVVLPDGTKQAVTYIGTETSVKF